MTAFEQAETMPSLGKGSRIHGKREFASAIDYVISRERPGGFV